MKPQKTLQLSGIVLLVALFSWIILNFNFVHYLLSQAYHQIDIIYKAKPVKDLWKDPSTSDSLKLKLRLIESIRIFAKKKLGLNDTKNYTTFYDQRGKPVLWNLYACKPFSFEEKIWGFPLIGSFPYKGFFNYELLEKEKMALEKEGYETWVSEVAGWSTLGWFKDPILSSMLEDSEGEIANTIIHELTHATIFIPDSTEQNENIATFIGDKGAELFLTQKYGTESILLKNYKDEKSDRKKYVGHLLRGYRLLDSLYTNTAKINISASVSPLPSPIFQLLSFKKDSLMNAIRKNMDTLSFRVLKFEHAKKMKMNNAFFTIYKYYHKKQNDMEEELQKDFKGDLNSMISKIRLL